MNYSEALVKLKEYNQEHILKYYEELSDNEKLELLAQIEATDFSVVAMCTKEDKEVKKGEISPLAAMQLKEIEERKEEFKSAGLDAI